MVTPDDSPVVNAKVALGDSSEALRTQTNSEGQFILKGIPLGLHSVWVRRKGIRGNIVRGIRVESGNPTPIEIVVEPGGVLSGTVVDADGQGVHGIEVIASSYELQESGRGPAQTTVRTDAEGRFLFDTLWDVSYEIQTETKEPFPMWIHPGKYEPDQDNILLVVEPGAVVSGRILDSATEKGIPDATLKYDWRGSVHIESEGAHGSSSGNATTDKEGRFHFCFGAPGEFRLSASKSGFSALEPLEPKELNRGDQVDGIEIFLGPVHAAHLEGSVVNGSGTPIWGAKVALGHQILYLDENSATFHRAGSGGGHGTTNTDGIFRLSLANTHARRSYLLQAVHPEHGVSRAVEVFVSDPTQESSVADLVLHAAAKLTGEVRFEDAPIPEARVYLEQLDPRYDEKVGRRSSDAWCCGRHASVNGSGIFEFASLGEGVYRIRIDASSFLGFESEELELHAGEVIHEQFILNRGETISGFVSNGEEEPIPAVQVVATQEGAKRNPLTHYAETDRNGFYRLENLRPGRYSIEIWPTEFLRQTRVRVAAGAEDVNFVLERPGRIETSAIDQDSGQPIKQFKARLWPVESTDESSRAPTSVGSDSTANPGTYYLEVLAPGYVPSRKMDHVVVSADETTKVEVSLEAGLSVVGTVVDESGGPVHGARIAIRPLRLDARKRKEVIVYTDEAGNFRQAGFVAGDYRINVYHAGYGERDVELNVGATRKALKVVLDADGGR